MAASVFRLSGLAPRISACSQRASQGPRPFSSGSLVLWLALPAGLSAAPPSFAALHFPTPDSVFPALELGVTMHITQLAQSDSDPTE